MNDILDERQEPQTFTDIEIFTQIWIKPRQILRYIHLNKYDKFVIILLIFAGITRAFNRAIEKDLGDTLPLLSIVGSCIVGGGLLGWITYYLYALLVSWTGRWLRGKGNTDSLMRVIAYAHIPSILALILFLPQIAFYGNEIFKSDGDLSSNGYLLEVIGYSSFIVQALLGLCTFIFFVIGIMEVQRFGIAKALLNILLPVLVVIVPIVILVLIFSNF
jgi:hypothetical protein